MKMEVEISWEMHETEALSCGNWETGVLEARRVVLVGLACGENVL